MENLVLKGKGTLEEFTRVYVETSLTEGITVKASTYNMMPGTGSRDETTFDAIYEFLIFYTVVETKTEKKLVKPIVKPAEKETTVPKLIF